MRSSTRSLIYAYLLTRVVDVEAEHGASERRHVRHSESNRAEEEGVRFDTDADALSQPVDTIQSSRES